MDKKPDTPLRRKKLKKIKQKDKALTLFTIANLALMVNTGIAGIIKSMGDLQAKERAALSWSQVGTEMIALIVTATFVFLSIAANQISKTKKHDEITVKAHELEHNNKIDTKREAAIATSSKTIINIDKSLTMLTSFFACIFIIFGMITIILQSGGHFIKAAHYQVIGCIAYILAVLLTLMNNVIGDKLQARIDKHYLGAEITEMTNNKDGFINRFTAYLYHLFANINASKGRKNLPLEKEAKSND